MAVRRRAARMSSAFLVSGGHTQRHPSGRIRPAVDPGCGRASGNRVCGELGWRLAKRALPPRVARVAAAGIPLGYWLWFCGFVVVALAIDLGLLHRHAQRAVHGAHEVAHHREFGLRVLLVG